jgi:glycine cleavage system H lipoate-binding protein
MLSHVIFLGLFYTVLAVLSATVALSLFRAAQDFRVRRAEAICWQATFPDLPARERVCRHEFTGEFAHRTCDKAFDCRECQTHAALVAERPPDAAPLSREAHQGEIFGLEFPLDRYYHRGHAWAHPQPDGTVTVGLDALGARLVAEPDAIELPAVGSHIQTNGAAWHVRKRGADVRILSPLDGEVVATSDSQNGWYLKVKPDGGQLDARPLLRGAEIRPWIAREMERLQSALAPAGQAPTMADGGVPVDDIAASYPDADWDAVCSEIFLQP